MAYLRAVSKGVLLLVIVLTGCAGVKQSTTAIYLAILPTYQGQVLHQERIQQAASTERVSVPMGNRSGMLLLNASTTTQRQQSSFSNTESIPTRKL